MLRFTVSLVTILSHGSYLDQLHYFFVLLYQYFLYTRETCRFLALPARIFTYGLGGTYWVLPTVCFIYKPFSISLIIMAMFVFFCFFFVLCTRP